MIEDESFWWLVVAVVAVAAFYMIARSVQLSKNALPVGITSTLAVIMLGGMLWWTAKMNGISLTFDSSSSMASDSGATTQPSDSANESAEGSPWIAFSNDAFQKARASGKPVLIKFTANWCSTCQVIEGTVFRDPAVWDYIHKNNIVMLKADFSRTKIPPAQAVAGSTGCQRRHSVDRDLSAWSRSADSDSQRLYIGDAAEDVAIDSAAPAVRELPARGGV